MNYFEHQLQLVLESFDWIDPDQLYDKDDSWTFIYYNGVLKVDYGDVTHQEMIISEPWFYFPEEDENELREMAPEELIEYGLRDSIPYRALLGRGGVFNKEYVYKGHIISFWNSDRDVYKDLPNCLKAMLNNTFLEVTEDTCISTPVHRRMLVGEVLKNSKEWLDIEPEPDDIEHAELIQKIHLMKPDQKKKAMKKLGLSPGSEKSGMQKTVEAEYPETRGNKWWAPYSESL